MRQHKLLLLSMLFCACGISAPRSQADSCHSSVECAPGDVCQTGRCVPVALSHESTCMGGVCCAEGEACFDPYVEACGQDGQGCECYVLHDGGGTPQSGLPRITLSAGDVEDVQAYAAVVGGAPLPPGPFDLEVVEGTSSVIASGTQLAATTQPGSAIVAARFGTRVRCQAEVVNLGTPPTDGRARVYLFDETTGAPVAGAQVVLDVDGDGVDDGGAPPTDVNGVTESTRPLAGPFDTTVFATGYDFVSILGEQAAHLTVPLTPRAVVRRVGGATGLLDYSEYETRMLEGGSLPYRLGMTSLSFPLHQLLDFDLGLLFGGPLPPSSCDSLPSPGCYTFDIPGLFNDTVAVWGGLVLSLGNKPLKPQFEVVGEPGRRFLWSMGGEFTSTDVAQLFDSVLAYTSPFCDCNVDDSCSAACSCDADCGATLSGRLLRAVAPLLSRTASGVRGNVSLAPASYDDWLQYITPPYGDERDANACFPVLDSGRGAYDSVPLKRPLRRFAQLTLPALPPDPAFVGSSMEGVVALTGVLARGAGYVPLGMAVGFDCSSAACVGHRNGGSGYDGVIDGQTICGRTGALLTSCPADVPEEVGSGHLGMFYAAPHGGLAEESWRTLLLALPVDSLDLDNLRISALIVDDEPSAIADGVAQRQFTPPPPSPTASGPRTFVLPASDGDLLRVSFAASGVVPHWVVLAAGERRRFVAPSPPPSFADPLAASSLEMGTARLHRHESQPLFARGATPLARLFDKEVDGFAVARHTLVQPGSP